MPFFNLFRRQAFRPSWEYTTKGILWRLVPSSGGLLVGEERVVETRTVSFFCVELSGGRPLWKEQAYGEQWWTGIETVCRDTLLLHGYASPDMPEHRGITGVDLPTGTLLWRNSEVRWVGTRQGYIRAERAGAGGAFLCELDRRTGEILRETGPDPHPGGAEAVRGNDEEPGNVRFPVILPGGAAGPSDLALLLRGAIDPGSIAGPVECMEFEECVIFGFNERDATSTQDAPGIRSVLAVMRRGERMPLFRMTLDEAVPFPVSDLFLVAGRTLLFVRGRRTLTALPVRT